MNNLCLSPNKDERARWATCNWIQSPKKKKNQNKTKQKKEEKEKEKVGLGSEWGKERGRDVWMM